MHSRVRPSSTALCKLMNHCLAMFARKRSPVLLSSCRPAVLLCRLYLLNFGHGGSVFHNIPHIISCCLTSGDIGFEFAHRNTLRIVSFMVYSPGKNEGCRMMAHVQKHLIDLFQCAVCGEREACQQVQVGTAGKRRRLVTYL